MSLEANWKQRAKGAAAVCLAYYPQKQQRDLLQIYYCFSLGIDLLWCFSRIILYMERIYILSVMTRECYTVGYIVNSKVAGAGRLP